MSDDVTVPNSFDGNVRLFPLPNVVLFPHVLLPLHIFEPRYRQMTADALATDRLITMVLLKQGAEPEHSERPALHSMACLGKIITEERLEDGRYYIFLRGLCRVRILHEIHQDKLYRSARVELLDDTGLPTPEQERRYRDEIAQAVATWFSAMGVLSEPLSKLLHSDLALSAFIDILGFALPFAFAFKQELLEELEVGKRARRLLHYLQTESPPEPMVTDRKFPPDFSAN
jgi:Lon protease-like protein